jgi:hypothetical protein
LAICTAASPTPPPAPRTSSVSRLFELRPVDQRMVRGRVGQRERRGHFVTDVVGQRSHLGGRHAHVLGEPAEPHESDHAIAVLDLTYALAHGIDGACHLRARNERQRRLHLVLALDDQRIREVHAGRPHADAHLARLRLWHGDIDQQQLLRPAPFDAMDRLHRFL